MSQPIKLYSHHPTGPNPWKVQIILEELGIPFESEIMDSSILHTPAFEKHNPNGRVPAIFDPNKNITLWESGAIVEYLVENYDPENTLHFSSFPEKYLTKQFLHFQMSGQGPYFGQAAWFTYRHPEQVDSARERYLKEIDRVTGVLDKVLESSGGYLVGGKCSYADLAFVPWYWAVSFIDKEQKGIVADLEKKYPHWAKWIKALNERPVVKKVDEERIARRSQK